MELDHFIPTLEVEAASVDAAIRNHPPLRPFYTLDFAGVDREQLKQAYLRLLKVTADYVTSSVPMLRAAGEALRDGDDEDRAWSELFLEYARDEIDPEGDYGHHVWARNDMIALGATPEFMDAPRHPSVAMYSKFFVEDAKLHPYAILGCKGVLEHASILLCDDLVKGVIASGIENADKAVSFFGHHGVLDIDHVREGDRNLQRIKSAARRSEILTGAFVTGGSYRAFLKFAV
jgi:hypothetical protein